MGSIKIPSYLSISYTIQSLRSNSSMPASNFLVSIKISYLVLDHIYHIILRNIRIMVLPTFMRDMYHNQFRRYFCLRVNFTVEVIILFYPAHWADWNCYA